jgi:hypothetical protein
MPKLAHIDDNVRMEKAFKPRQPQEMRELSTTLSQKIQMAMDSFLRDRVDA